MNSFLHKHYFRSPLGKSYRYQNLQLLLNTFLVCMFLGLFSSTAYSAIHEAQISLADEGGSVYIIPYIDDENEVFESDILTEKPIQLIDFYIKNLEGEVVTSEVSVEDKTRLFIVSQSLHQILTFRYLTVKYDLIAAKEASESKLLSLNQGRVTQAGVSSISSVGSSALVGCLVGAGSGAVIGAVATIWTGPGALVGGAVGLGVGCKAGAAGAAGVAAVEEILNYVVNVKDDIDQELSLEQFAYLDAMGSLDKCLFFNADGAYSDEWKILSATVLLGQTVSSTDIINYYTQHFFDVLAASTAFAGFQGVDPDLPGTSDYFRSAAGGAITSIPTTTMYWGSAKNIYTDLQYGENLSERVAELSENFEKIINENTFLLSDKYHIEVYNYFKINSSSYDFNTVAVQTPSASTGNVSGYIRASDDTRVSGVVSFQLGDEALAVNIISLEEGYYFSRDFDLPDNEQLVELSFVSVNGTEAHTSITIPAKEDQEGGDDGNNEPVQPGTSLFINDLEISNNPDGRTAVLKGYVRDNQGNNPSGKVTISTPNGSKWKSFGIGTDPKGSFFQIDSLNKNTYDRLENLTIETTNGLTKETVVQVPGTSGQPSPNPNFQFIEPNSDTKWRIGTGNDHLLKWNSVGINPEHTYRFHLYNSNGTYVDKLGRRGANQREDSQLFNGYVPGVYKIRVQNEDTGEYLAWSKNFVLTNTNDRPISKDLKITVFSGQQVSNNIWFDEINDDPVTLSLSVSPGKGNVALQQTGAFTYTANVDASGDDSFKVTISDGSLTNEATVSITLIDENELTEFKFIRGWNHGGSINDIEVENNLIYTAGSNDDTIRIFDFQGNLVDALEPGNSGFLNIAVKDGYIAAIDYAEDLFVFSEQNRTLLWSKNDMAGSNSTDLVIGEGNVYISFGSNELEQIKRYSLASGVGGEFAYYSGEYYTDGDDIEVIYFYRFSKTSGNDIIFFTGTDGRDEELHWWEEEGATGDRDGDENFGDDLTSIFARDGFLYGGDGAGDLKKMKFTGSTFDENSQGGFEKTDLHSSDIVTIYSNGAELFTGSNDKSVKIWNDTDASLKQTISSATNANAHTDMIIGLAYTNGYLITADRSGAVKVWARNFIPTGVVDDIITWSDLDASVVIDVTDMDESDTHSFNISTSPINGVASVNEVGVINYAPDKSFYGTDSFKVTISDGKDSDTVDILVTIKNRPPKAIIETSGFNTVGTKGQPVILTGSGMDPEGDSITAYQWILLDKPEASTTDLSTASNVSTSFTPDVSGLYTVSLQVSAGDSLSIIATADISVTNSVPDPFVGNFVTSINNSTSALIFPGDANLTDTHSLEIVSQPNHGNVIVLDLGIIHFTPENNYTGDDSFTIKVTDNWGATANLVVDFIVENTPPVAINRTIKAHQGMSYTGSIYGYDSNGHDIVFRIISTAENGSFNLLDFSTGAFEYSPDSDFMGEDLITFVVNDGYVDSEIATLAINVTNAMPEIISTNTNNITLNEAIIEVDIKSNGLETDVTLSYGLSIEALSIISDPISIPPSLELLKKSFVLVDLKCGTTYYYKVSALNSDGEDSGDIKTFNTLQCQSTEPIIKGDINNDENIDLKDTILTLKLTSGINQGVDVFKNADVNNDDKIGAMEAIYSLQVTSKLKSPNMNHGVVIFNGFDQDIIFPITLGELISVNYSYKNDSDQSVYVYITGTGIQTSSGVTIIPPKTEGTGSYTFGRDNAGMIFDMVLKMVTNVDSITIAEQVVPGTIEFKLPVTTQLNFSGNAYIEDEI